MKALAVFDLDGTLVDSRAAIGAAITGAWRALDLEPPDYEKSRYVVGLSLIEAVKILAPELSPARYGELSEAYRAAYLDNRAANGAEPLYAGARESLASLRDAGWALGIATGKSRPGIERFFGANGLGDWFDCAFCADDGPGKPDPHMLNLNIKAIGADPARTVMIGDTSHDMKMARAANVYALGVSWGFHTAAEIRDSGAHAVAESFADLDEALVRRAWP